jgi:hypothetical protein
MISTVAIFGFDFFCADLVSVFDTRHGKLCAILMVELEKKRGGGARLLTPLTPAVSGTMQGADFDNSVRLKPLLNPCSIQ